jgi:transposase
MRPYFVDFRQKIIDVWKKEKISIRGLAQRFDVAKSFIPRPQGGSPPTKLNSEQLIILIEIIEFNNDATLEELSDLLYEKTQVKVSRATLGRLTQKLNYSFKKKHYTRRKKKVTGCSKKECNTGPKFGKLRHQN